MILRIITKNHAADPEIGSLTKSNPKPYGRATAMPTAWELTTVAEKHRWQRKQRILFSIWDRLF